MPKLNEAPASEGDRLGPEGGTKSEETAMSGEEPAQSNDMYKNAQRLSAKEWTEIIETNRLLHGFQIRSEVSDVVRAKRPAFVLKALDEAPEPADGAMPCFQVVDGSNIQVHETKNAFQRSLAQNAFSKRCIDTELSAGDIGIQAGLSGGRGREQSTSDENSSLSEGQEYHASYNFARARIFLDEYELALSEDCKTHLEEIESNQSTRSLRDFEAKFGHVFATSVLLGGQQRTVKFAGAMELKTDEQRQDAVRGALGAKIVAPYVSASFQYSKGRGSGSSRKDEEYADLSYLGMSASGGDTLIGADVPRWAKTVAPPENWRVIGNEIAEPLSSLIASITSKEYIPGLFLWIRSGKPKPAILKQLSKEQQNSFREWLAKTNVKFGDVIEF